MLGFVVSSPKTRDFSGLGCHPVRLATLRPGLGSLGCGKAANTAEKAIFVVFPREEVLIRSRFCTEGDLNVIKVSEILFKINIRFS